MLFFLGLPVWEIPLLVTCVIHLDWICKEGCESDVLFSWPYSPRGFPLLATCTIHLDWICEVGCESDVIFSWPYCPGGSPCELPVPFTLTEFVKMNVNQMGFFLGLTVRGIPLLATCAIQLAWICEDRCNRQRWRCQTHTPASSTTATGRPGPLRRHV